METSVSTDDGIVPLNKGAGFWIRALARFVDLIMLTIFSGMIGLVVGVVFGLLAVAGAVPESRLEALGETTVAAFLIAVVADIAYHAICESMHGATLGKLICGLHVLRPDGSTVSFGSALGRSVAFLIDGLFFGLVGYSSMGSSGLRQRFGDKWANTMVVSRADHPARQWPSAGRFAISFLLALAIYGLLIAFSLATKV